MKQQIKLSYTEENYLKAIYHLSDHGKREVSTNAIAEHVNTKAASVSDMLKKLAAKNVVHYQRYMGVRISEEGKVAALLVIRKHRLWEVFLVDKLGFQWDEVHEIAEQLEHIRSTLLTKRLDEFLGFPQYDPHGDPIPNERGELLTKHQFTLGEMEIGHSGTVVGVKETTPVFLQYLDKVGIYLGARLKVLDKVAFDNSLELQIDGKKTVIVSRDVSQNIFLRE